MTTKAKPRKPGKRRVPQLSGASVAFGRAVQAARIDRKLSQRELARRVAVVSYQTISQIEQGRECGLTPALTIARMLDLSLDALHF